ncbi:hypothetical protein AB9P05_03300 [Roseivirga sp. BDSF3-8]|uniref:hypothetical protein n=1 Tax=Roseivirga sp. BDSF3-8 TaxID=3241598 RepID=UPI003531A4C1
MRKKVFILSALVMMSGVLPAQDYLVLYKSGTQKKYTYKEGATIRLTTKRTKEAFLAKLDIIEKDYFLNGIDTIYFRDIHQLYLPKPVKASRATRMLGKAMRISGFGIVILDLANQAVIDDEPFKANTGIWIAGIITGGIGLLPELITRKKRKVKGLWKVQMRYNVL